MPDANKGIERSSSNNKLGNRENTQRIGGRIPDIFGTVLAIPDLIAPPLRYFQNNVEIEECLMCLGRGYYEISDVKRVKPQLIRLMVNQFLYMTQIKA